MLGIPASGKTTHAKSLAAALGVPCITTEDFLLCRDSESSETESIGRAGDSDDGDSASANDAVDEPSKPQASMEKKWLEIMVQRLQQEDCKAGFVLDGVPNTSAELAALQAANLLPPVAIILEVQRCHVFDPFGVSPQPAIFPFFASSTCC